MDEEKNNECSSRRREKIVIRNFVKRTLFGGKNNLEFPQDIHPVRPIETPGPSLNSDEVQWCVLVRFLHCISGSKYDFDDVEWEINVMGRETSIGLCAQKKNVPNVQMINPSVVSSRVVMARCCTALPRQLSENQMI